MKATFKPLGLVVAVAAVSAGYAGVTNAQSAIAAGNLGDVAIVPYYTVNADWVTGVHITNTSDLTQVVKLRMRRASDSMDALDFNIILSPYDVWTGLIHDNSGIVEIGTGDNTCTAPLTGGSFPMPQTSATDRAFEGGAEEGYIEIIGMGSATIDQPIAVAALHGADGVPANCNAVESNFFRNATEANPAPGTATKRGVTSYNTSNQDGGLDSNNSPLAPTTISNNEYGDTGNVLSVSYFIRDNASGVEFGSNAVHITDFNDEAMMSNQAKLITGTFEPYGFYFPDLDGGPSDGREARGLFDTNVRPALGVLSVINDWSVGNADNQIETDWVITLPGQYLMVEFQEYVESLFTTSLCAANTCDYRDIPVVANILYKDREERGPTSAEEGLVISPGAGAPSPDILLHHEVNVIKWNNAGLANSEVPGVLNSAATDDQATSISSSLDLATFGAENGWAELSISSTLTKDQKVCEVTGVNVDETCNDVVNTAVPMVGFAAWQRTLPNDPSASYGRIVDHAFTVASSS